MLPQYMLPQYMLPHLGRWMLAAMRRTAIMLVGGVPLSVGSADAQMHLLSESLKANTEVVRATDTGYAYGFIMRKLFLYARFGKISQLPAEDIARIRREGASGDTRSELALRAMQPAMDKIILALQRRADPVSLAILRQQAIDAERRGINEYYRDYMARLSSQGQAVLRALYAHQLASAEMARTDYVAVAHDAPLEFVEHLEAYAESFPQRLLDSQ